jgi:bacterioferritin-associated ferredoxin
MYVCICHAITDGDIGEAESKGAQCEIDVFTHYGVKPQCGRCVPSMRCMMKCAFKAAQASTTQAAVEQPRDPIRKV